MNTGVNNKRVFCVVPHRPIGFGEMLGKRGDIRLDILEQKNPDEARLRFSPRRTPIRSSSARDELAGHYQARAELLGRTPNLLIVSTNGAGYDTVDVKACTERGILVVNQSGGNAEAVAEHVIGMMLCLVKRVNDSDRALRAGTLKNRTEYIGREAFGKTIGIVGLGNVGKRIAELAGTLFRMKVLAYDPYLTAEVVRARGAEKVELDELLRRSDFVSINCPLTDETRKIDRRARIRADAAGRLFHHHGARLHPRRGGAGTGAARQENRRRRPRRLGEGAAAGQPSADEIRQRDGDAAHGGRDARKRAPGWARSRPSRCSTRSTASRCRASSIRRSGRPTPSASSAPSASSRRIRRREPNWHASEK